MAHNPWVGDRQPLAWGAILGLLRVNDWVPHAAIRDAGMANGLQANTVDRLMLKARDYGVLARRGSWDGKEKKDFREYRLLPRDWLNASAETWVEVPPRYVCGCGKRADGRAIQPDTGDYAWMCRKHLEKARNYNA